MGPSWEAPPLGGTVPDPGWSAPPPASGAGSGGRAVPVPLVIGAVVVVALVAGYLILGRGDGGGGAGTRRAGNGALTSLVDAPSSEPDEEPVWAEDLGCEAGACSLAADGSRVYLLTADDDGEAVLNAYGLGSGEEEWENTKVDGASRVLVALDRLLVLTSEETIALDPEDGEELWSVDGVLEPYTEDGLALATGNDGGGSSELTVIDLDDGEAVWDGDGYPAGLCGGVLVVSDSGDEVVAYDWSSGDERWKQDTDGAGVYCNDDGVHLVSSEEQEVTSLDLADGEERWKVDVEDASYGQAFRDRLVVSTSLGSNGSDLVVLDTADGEVAWEADGGDLSLGIVEELDDGVLLNDDDEKYQLIDLDDGEEIESSSDGDAPVFSEDLVLHFDGDEIVAQDLADLEEAWNFDVGDEVHAWAVAGGRLVIADADEVAVYE